MMNRVLVFWFLLVLGCFLIGCAATKSERVASRPPGEPVFDIAAYGAVNDPTVSSADAFRRAIADCQKAGGGTVRHGGVRWGRRHPVESGDPRRPGQAGRRRAGRVVPRRTGTARRGGPWHWTSD